MVMLSITQILNEAAAYIHRGWVKGEFAEDADGNGVEPTSPRAVCWCLAGAIQRAVADHIELPGFEAEDRWFAEASRRENYRRCVRALARTIAGLDPHADRGRFFDAPTVWMWQDRYGRTQDEVIDLLMTTANIVEVPA